LSPFGAPFRTPIEYFRRTPAAGLICAALKTKIPMLKNLSAWRLFGGSAEAGSEPRRAFVLALLDIYQRYGVYIGGQLEYADLVREWPAAGFRRSDLEAGLDDAVAAGLLEFSSDCASPALTLLSTEMPSRSKAPLMARLRRRAADRTLQIQRSRVNGVAEWTGENRRHGADAAF
jgi:hypothetical protein